MIQFTLIGNADMNNLVHSSFYTCLSISVGYIPLIRIAGSKVITCICNLDRYCKTALLKGHNNLSFHQHYMRRTVS